MPSPIEVSLPFMAAVGTAGSVHLVYHEQCGSKAHLSITVGHIINGSTAHAHLAIGSLHQLVDGLMECIYAIERHTRITGDSPKGGGNGHAA